MLDLCSHVLPNMQADAAAIVDDALRAAQNEARPKGSKTVAMAGFDGLALLENARYIGLSRVSSAVEQRFCKSVRAVPVHAD